MNISFRKWIMIEVVAVPLFVLTFITVGFVFGLSASVVTEAVDLARTMGISFGVLFLFWIFYTVRKNLSAKKAAES